jgi:Asp-tRNA(Asn)/Glu-tRNA(Gln) amidotransferase C subunit
MEKKRFKQITESLMLHSNEETIKNIEKKCEEISPGLKNLVDYKIPENTIPMIRVDDHCIFPLREDVPVQKNFKATLLLNAVEKNDNFVLIDKVVK